MSRVLFQNALLGDRRCDLRVAGDVIADRRWRDEGAPLEPLPGEEVVQGGLITAPFAEPHVHLDAALLGTRMPNRSGTLREGIANWSQIRPGMTHEDVRERALKTVEMYTRQGTLRIRTHVDVGNLVSVETILGLKEELAGRGIALQVVAFPQEGILRTPGLKAQWEEAVRMGCDAVGAIPHFERTTEEGWKSVRLAFDLAERLDRMVDLHCDETDDPGSRNLEVACAEAMDRGFRGRVVAGHCTALHSYPNPYAAKVIELVVEAGVQVVANPLDNAVLQGRYDGYPRRRGLTRVDELWAAGAMVGIGHDSVQDPWYRLGTASMLDTAYMLVHLGQLTGEDDIRRVFRTLCAENHLPFGGPPELAPGRMAQLLWWAQEDPIDILRDRSDPRVVY
jgi:cytosine deaminase